MEFMYVLHNLMIDNGMKIIRHYVLQYINDLSGMENMLQFLNITVMSLEHRGISKYCESAV